MLKVIRTEYTNPIDNLASLKHSIVPQMTKIHPMQATKNVASARDLFDC